MVRTSIFCRTLLSAIPVHAQAPDAASTETFEVTSIKLTDPNFTGTLIQTPGRGRITFRGFTLTDLIGFAFDVDKRLVVGIPKTLDAARYDVVGQSDQIGNPTATFGRKRRASHVAGAAGRTLQAGFAS